MTDSDDECLHGDPNERYLLPHTSKAFDIEQIIHVKGTQQRTKFLEEHENKKHFSCSESNCGRSFSSKFKLMRHKLIHSGERQFKCSACARCFHRKDHLKNHLQIHDPNKIIHSCEHCGKTYSSLLSFRKHLAFHAAEGGDLICKLCGKVFTDKESIMYHLKVHTGSRTLKGPSERKFKCDQCERSFFTRKDVKRHMVVHTGIRNFICQLCPQRFGRKDHLVRHIKKSHGNHASLQKSPVDSTNNVESHLSILSNSDRMDELIIPDLKNTVNVDQSDNLPLLHSAIKQEPSIASTSSDSVQLTRLPIEDGDCLARLGEIAPSIMSVSQYLPVPSFNLSIPHLSPSCYLSTVPGPSNLLPNLAADTMLGPVLGSSLPTYTSTDMGNPSLPHFSQAFQ